MFSGVFRRFLPCPEKKLRTRFKKERHFPPAPDMGCKKTASHSERKALNGENVTSSRHQMASSRQGTTSFRHQMASSRQRMTSFRQQAASFRQQAASSRQQMASSHRQMASFEFLATIPWDGRWAGSLPGPRGATFSLTRRRERCDVRRRWRPHPSSGLRPPSPLRRGREKARVGASSLHSTDWHWELV